MKNRMITTFIFSTFLIMFGCNHEETTSTWQPVVDWGHWRLGQKADLDFLQKNQMTLTFGGGAPNFESVTREEFDQKIEEARAFNASYHEKGYIVLRYLSTSLNGETVTNKDQPRKDQIDYLTFYNERWNDFTDLIGPRPEADPTSWIMVRPDGTFPHYRYAPYGRETTGEFEAWGCPDNPDYVRVMEAKISAQATTGIDGSYVDWTHIAGGTCYCDYTRLKFIQYLKENLPPDVGQAKYGTSDYDPIQLPRERGDKFWMEWVVFRGYTVAEFHRKLRQAARKVNPSFLISGNIFGGFGYGPIAYDAAGNIEFLGRAGYDDFIYSEIQEFLDSAPRKTDEGTKISNSPALKFLSAASHGKPVIVYATEITPPIFPNPTEKCLSAMAKINIAEAVANHAIFREKRQTPPGATEMYQFLAANEQYLLGAQLSARVAVLASLNQYLADEISFAFSASRVLADNGIAHIMLVEDDLLNVDLTRYDLIWLPYLPLLSEVKQNALRQYVDKGGKLLVLGECGKKNQYNLPQNPLVLANMLGHQQFPEERIERDTGDGIIVYLPLSIPDHRFLIPAKAKSEFTTFGPSMADIFPDIPEGYTRNRMHPELRIKLEMAVDEILKLQENNLTQLSESHPLVELTLMENKSEERMLLHLVNYDVTLDGDITPQEMLPLQISLPDDKEVNQVLYAGDLSQLKPIQYEVQNSGEGRLLNTVLGKLELYGLIVVELK